MMAETQGSMHVWTDGYGYGAIFPTSQDEIKEIHQSREFLSSFGDKESVPLRDNYATYWGETAYAVGTQTLPPDDLHKQIANAHATHTKIAYLGQIHNDGEHFSARGAAKSMGDPRKFPAKSTRMSTRRPMTGMSNLSKGGARAVESGQLSNNQQQSSRSRRNTQRLPSSQRRFDTEERLRARTALSSRQDRLFSPVVRSDKSFSGHESSGRLKSAEFTDLFAKKSNALNNSKGAPAAAAAAAGAGGAGRRRRAPSDRGLFAARSAPALPPAPAAAAAAAAPPSPQPPTSWHPPPRSRPATALGGEGAHGGRGPGAAAGAAPAAAPGSVDWPAFHTFARGGSTFPKSLRYDLISLDRGGGDAPLTGRLAKMHPAKFNEVSHVQTFGWSRGLRGQKF